MTYPSHAVLPKDQRKTPCVCLGEGAGDPGVLGSSDLAGTVYGISHVPWHGPISPGVDESSVGVRQDDLHGAGASTSLQDISALEEQIYLHGVDGYGREVCCLSARYSRSTSQCFGSPQLPLLLL